jgi:hypothetical protein
MLKIGSKNRNEATASWTKKPSSRQFVAWRVTTKMTTRTPSRHISPLNMFYGPAVLLLAFGGIWALLDVNAMNERFQIRHDIDVQQIGTLNSIYFAAGKISPFIGGYIMDHCRPRTRFLWFHFHHYYWSCFAVASKHSRTVYSFTCRKVSDWVWP